MKLIKTNKLLIIIVILFAILLSFYLIREYFASRKLYTESYLNGEEYIMNPKTYNVNEYSLTNITDDQMVNIYLNDYKYYLSNDISYAYNLLNEEYRNIKFGSLDNFQTYVNNLDFSNIIATKFSKKSDDYKYYKIYDKAGNTYIFKITSVMEYEVYLDDYTIEM